MHIFDYSFLDNGLLPARIVNLTATISAFKAISGERMGKNQKIYTELEAIARVQSVKGSNAIEGIVTTDARIKAIVEGNSAPLNHNEMEIAGYRDALDEVHKHHMQLSFSEEVILHLHQAIQGVAGTDSGGKYKDEDNLIMEVDVTGRRSVRFRPVSAAQTKDAMEQLVFAYMDARNNPNINCYWYLVLFLIFCAFIHLDMGTAEFQDCYRSF